MSTFDGLTSLMSSPPTEQSGVLTLADINAMFETMRNDAYSDRGYIFISPRMRKRLIHWERVGRLYHAHPLPDYAIRKCVRRRIVAARRAGMKRIHKMERREEQAEQAILRGTPQLTEPFTVHVTD